MKPRVFVSSTYYDLKHVRERLERFIENYNFEPVLFESDNVIFEPGQKLDDSCYNEVNLCHIMILIIGGRYGGAVSGEKSAKKKELYDKEFISITRREFETASKNNLPVFIFLDKNVQAEYQTYVKNVPFFEKEKSFKFAHVDSVNIFRFINHIYSIPTLAVKTFEKVEEIENYLSNQFAGLFYKYLESLKNDKKEKEILNSVSELKSITERMDVMLQEVGKKVITDEDEYEEVIFDQKRKLIEYYVQVFFKNIHFQNLLKKDPRQKASKEFFSICQKILFNKTKLDNFFEKKEDSISERSLEFCSIVNENKNLPDVESIKTFTITYNYYYDILPIISESPQLKKYFEKQMIDYAEVNITELPF